MVKKFSSYDFFGYIIPGAVLILFLSWTSTCLFRYTFPLGLTSIGDSILFLVLSYAAGNLLCILANQLMDMRIKQWGGWWSVKFLRKDDTKYSPSFKIKLRNAIKDCFKVNIEPSKKERMFAPTPEELKILDDKKKQEAFNLCYTLVIQKRIAAHTEIFNTFYGLYINMLTVLFIGAALAFFIVLKNIAGWILIKYNPDLMIPMLLFDEFEFIIALALGTVFALMIKPMETRFIRFAESFVDSVYRSFLVWYSSRSSAGNTIQS